MTELDRKWIAHVRSHAFKDLTQAARAIAKAEAIDPQDLLTVMDAVYRRLRSFARRGFIAKHDGYWVAALQDEVYRPQARPYQRGHRP